MKQFLFITSVVSITCLMVIACTKHKGDIEAPVLKPSAVITFSKPTEGTIYKTGDNISIQAKAIALNTVHGYDVKVKKANDTTTYFFTHVHDHNDTLYVNQQWKLIPAIANNLEAEITLYLDHDGNTAVKKVGFKVEKQ